MSGDHHPVSGMTRRSFLKTTGLAAGAVAATNLAAHTLVALAEDDSSSSGEARAISCSCRSNCMGSCRLTATVRDGKLVKLEAGEYPDDRYTGCCLKGLSYIERMYSPTRIQYPLKRVGERGAGEWERIGWDEAINMIAEAFKDAQETSGDQAVVLDTASGNYGYINGLYNIFGRLAAVMGCTKTAACYDYAAGHGVDRVLGTGDWAYCNEPNAVMDSSMVVIWATNPVYTAPNNWRWLRWAQENGTKLVSIDAIKSATAYKCDEFIQVRPSHDGYLALAMANHIVKRDLVDWDFLRERTNAACLVRSDTGMLLRKSDFEEVPTRTVPGLFGSTEVPIDDFYVYDKEADDFKLISEAEDPQMEGHFTARDGIEVDTAFSLLKEQLSQYTVAEAARLTGLEEGFIEQFAERWAAERAVSINITYGMDHYINGYQNTWACAILQCLTGNLAKPGAGFSGVFTSSWTPNYLTTWLSEEYKLLNTVVPFAKVPEMFATQTLAGRPYPVKAMLSYCSNPFSNLGSQNQWFNDFLPNCDFYCVIDNEMTDSAVYADLVLPHAMWYEVEDLRSNTNNPYTLYQEKCVEPIGESKPDFEIVGLIGRAMGFEKSFPESMTSEDLLRIVLSDAKSQEQGWTLERFREERCIHTSGNPGEPLIRGSYAPFPTEDGRARLYTEVPRPRLNYGQDLEQRSKSEHLVYYQPPAEAGVDDPLADKYPLVYVQEHSRFRVHTQWWNTPILRELDREPLAKVSGKDAAERGVVDGDIVEVFNDRGHAVLRCMVDESVAPGILSIPKGWQRSQYIEGCYQEMTQPQIDDYASACSFYDTRVDFRKWEG